MINVVYEISIGNSKQIGSTCELDKRVRTHQRQLVAGNHPNSHMQAAFNKHRTFSWTVLSEHSSREGAYMQEQHQLNQHFGTSGYLMQNKMASGAAPGVDNISKRPDVRQKKSIAAKRWLNNNPHALAERSARVLGDKNPAKRLEVRQKMSKNHHMRHPEARQAFSRRITGAGNPYAKPILDVEAGISYDTMRQCCQAAGISYDQLALKIKKGERYVRLKS